MNLHEQLNVTMNEIHDIADGIRQDIDGKFSIGAESLKSMRVDAAKIMAAITRYENLLKGKP